MKHLEEMYAKASSLSVEHVTGFDNPTLENVRKTSSKSPAVVSKGLDFEE